MTLEEWAQSLRLHGNAQQAEFAVEILEYIDRDSEFERLQSLEEDLLYKCQRHDLEQDLPTDKILEWLSMQADLVNECNNRLGRLGFRGVDLDDQCEELARIVVDITETLEKVGGFAPNDIDSKGLDTIIFELCQRPKYDL